MPTERGVSPQLGLLKSTLLQLDSTFSERNYGAGSFRDFVEKLAKAGVLTVYPGKGGWLVAPTDGAPPAAEISTDESDAQPGESRTAPAATQAPATDLSPNGHGPIAVLGSPADGLTEFRKLLSTAEIRRWPMYLRNVKQVFRQASPAFDERAYGFGNVVDLLRAAQKDGIVRVERDRQGVVRVFQGAAAGARGASSVPEPTREQAVPQAAAAAPTPEAAAIAPDLSVGPGNDLSTPPAETARRRARTTRPRAATARRPRKKATPVAP